MNLPLFGFGAVEAELWRLLFAMLRIGAALMAAPLFGGVAVPVQARIVASGAIAVFVCAWSAVTPPPALFSLAGMVAVAGEVVIGLGLGFVLQLAFAAPLIAAETIGGSMGLSMAVAADPLGGGHSTALGQYYLVVMVAIFFGLGGHLHWLRLVIDSYAVFPPGAAWPAAGHAGAIAGFAGDMFAAAATIALPVTLVLLLVQLATGVLGRAAPALNLFALGLPLGVLAGIAALIAAAPLTTERLVALNDDTLTAIAKGITAR